MSSWIPMLTYGAAVGLALALLYCYESRSWYWHAFALALAFVIGFFPAPESFQSPGLTLMTGFGVIFLLFWGLGGLLLSMEPHRHKHA